MSGDRSYNFGAWVQRVEAFPAEQSRRLASDIEIEEQILPPLGLDKVSALEAELDRAIPEGIRRFIGSGSSGCSFRYSWTVSGASRGFAPALYPDGYRFIGGASLCHATELAQWLEDCQRWANDTWIAEEPEEQEFWLESFPIASLANGDYLGVRASEASQDSPVVYLSHDGASQIISPSFSGFLATWEGLCYVGPESWLLEPFFDPETGYLSAETNIAAELRSLFGIK